MTHMCMYYILIMFVIFVPAISAVSAYVPRFAKLFSN